MVNNGLFEPVAGMPMAGPQNALGAAPPTQADAYEYHAQGLQKWIAEQRVSGVAAGTIDPDSGWPTQKGVLDGVRQWGDAMIGGTSAPGFRAFHASPYSFNAFDTAKIGTGEGAQAFGHGLYVAGDEAVKNSYLRQFEMHPAIQDQRNAWSERVSGLNHQLDTLGTQIDKARRAGDDAAVTELQKQYRPLHDEWSKIQNKAPKPVSYEVQVNADPAHFLDWDKPRDQQPAAVQAFFAKNHPEVWDQAADGSSLYQLLQHKFRYDHPGYADGGLPPADWQPDRAAASNALKSAGIPGIRYLDGGSRAGGTGTSNHVIFDPATIEILRKYGIAGLIAGGGAAAAGHTEQQ